jgi:hypothetical protein
MFVQDLEESTILQTLHCVLSPASDNYKTQLTIRWIVFVTRVSKHPFELAVVTWKLIVATKKDILII